MKPPPDVVGSVRVTGGTARVMLAGELDHHSAPAVEGLLQEALTSGATSVELDLALVTFCDAAGLGVLVGAKNRLTLQGAELAITGAPVTLRRLLTITGLTGSLHVAPATTGDGQLAAELAAAVRRPLVQDVLDAALRLVVQMSQHVMLGADGVSITLPRDGRLATIAASNDTVLMMDQDQYATGEGPCLDAARQGEMISSSSLDGEQRWPRFVPRAQARGIASIMSVPLLSADRPLGALNVYSRAANALAAHEQRWATEFATQASQVLKAADNAVTASSAEEQINAALQSRETIALAQGVVMARKELGPDAAFRYLTDLSRLSDRPMAQICGDVVASITPPGPALDRDDA